MHTSFNLSQMLKSFAMLSVSTFAAAAMANTPVGQWHTIDDKTGELKSMVVIVEQQGVIKIGRAHV